MCGVSVAPGRRDSPGDALLAAAGAGIARQVYEYALDNDYDLERAGVLASAFAEAGLRGIDPNLIGALGRPEFPTGRAIRGEARTRRVCGVVRQRNRRDPSGRHVQRSRVVAFGWERSYTP